MRRRRIDLELMAGDTGGEERRVEEVERRREKDAASRRLRNSISFLFRYLKAESNYPLTFEDIIETDGRDGRSKEYPASGRSPHLLRMELHGGR